MRSIVVIFVLVGLFGLWFAWFMVIPGLLIAILLFYYFRTGNKDVKVVQEEDHINFSSTSFINGFAHAIIKSPFNMG